MLKGLIDARKKRTEAVNRARENFVSWREIASSQGWMAYQEAVNKKIEIVENRLKNDTSLTGEDLKRLQLALQVWNEVNRIPKELAEKAKGGLK